MIALDLPGHGESAALPEDETFLEACRAALAAVLDAFALDRVDAWGDGGGATVLADFARHQPARIRALSMTNAPELPLVQAG